MKNLLLPAFALAIIIMMLVPGLATEKSGENANEPKRNHETRQPPAPMTTSRIDELIKRVDEKAVRQDQLWQLTVAGIGVTVITDEHADRMRIMVPITEASNLDQQILYRLLQANFDSALDARYSIARGVLWSAFIHPLTSLSNPEFLSGLGQTVNLVTTFGTSFSSGALLFRGGDSENLHEKQLIEELLKKGQLI